MIVAIVGPTGVGKTKLSLELAKKMNGIIINCDAVQIYQELNIGSAKISYEEQENIPHYLLDFKKPNEKYTVYDYQKDARKLIAENNDKTIIFVGGTGLYLKAVIYDYIFPDEKEQKTYDNISTDKLYQLALEKDNSCDIHPHNRQRLIRFLNKKNLSKQQSSPLYSAIIIGLTTDREQLYEIINNRVDEMIKNGLIEEVKNLINKYPDAKILNTAIGYKEIKNYLEGKLTLKESIALIKQNSRHYAKRQYTFFNHQLSVNWFNVDYNNFNNTITDVENFLKKH